MTQEYQIKTKAAFLRTEAIEHLRGGEGVVAESFRKEYKKIFGAPYRTFLDKQGKNGVWGTYLELSALGELYKFKIVITSKDNGQENTWVLYEPENPDQVSYPTLYIHCEENRHFTYKGLKVDGNYYPHHGDTLGDGNCLYNAFGQGEIAYSTLRQDPEAMFPENDHAMNVTLNEDFILESQRSQWEEYNKEHGVVFEDSKVATPYNRYELMDRMLAIELALSEEKVFRKNHAQTFFKEPSCVDYDESTDEEKLNKVG